MKTVLRAFLAALTVGLIVGLPLGCVTRAHADNIAAFTADEYIAVALEYAGPRTLVGVDTRGPIDKPEICVRGLAAAISQAQNALPPGHVLIGTCLHVRFNGPLSVHGSVVTPPFQGLPLGYVLIAVMHDAHGAFVGARALHGTRDAATCQRESQDLIDTNAKEGNIPPGASFVIYCLPVPALHSSLPGADGTQSI